MAENLIVHELFPTPLWVVDFDQGTSDRLNRDLLQRIHAITEPKSPLGVGGSWQTDPTLHKRPEFDELLQLIRKFAKDALANFGRSVSGWEENRGDCPREGSPRQTPAIGDG